MNDSRFKVLLKKHDNNNGVSMGLNLTKKQCMLMLEIVTQHENMILEIDTTKIKESK